MYLGLVLLYPFFKIIGIKAFYFKNGSKIIFIIQNGEH